jgi:hypothetical protein
MIVKGYPKMGAPKSITLATGLWSDFLLRFFGPTGLSILPDFLCWWALEVQEYVCAPTA